MGTSESDDELAYRLGVALGMDFALPITHPIVAQLKPGTLPSFLNIHTETDPTLPRDTIVFRTIPPRPDSWVRDHFIEKGHTMPVNDQTEIILGYEDNLTPDVKANPVLHDHQPAARRTDPGTSYAAAASVRGAGTIRGRVYQILSIHNQGLTHEQIIDAYASSVEDFDWPRAAPQSIRSRTKELERDGLVKRNARAIDKTRAGRLTHRWFAVTDPNEQKRLRAAHEEAERDAAHQAHVETTLAESMANIMAPTMVSLDNLPPELRHQMTITTPETLATVTPSSSRGPVPFSDAARGVMAEDIKAARRSGAFKADEMAAFLIEKGWR